MHETEPGSLKKPVAQGVHASAPPVESVFLGHWTCPLLATLVLFPAPTLWQNAAPAAANWPAEHLTHEASAPPVLKLSAPHSVHSVPSKNVPGPHMVQNDEPVGLSGGPLVQIEHSIWPVALVNFPSGHASQTVFDVVVQALATCSPGWHAVHWVANDCPDAGW